MSIPNQKEAIKKKTWRLYLTSIYLSMCGIGFCATP